MEQNQFINRAGAGRAELALKLSRLTLTPTCVRVR